MKNVIALFLILLVAANLYAQNKTLDSLKLQLSKETTDTGRVNQLLELGGRFGFGSAKNDSAFWYSQRALELSQKINYVKGEIYARFYKAKYLEQTGNYPKALKLSFLNLKMAKQFHQHEVLFLQIRLTGWIYRDMRDYKTQLEYEKELTPLAHTLASKDTTVPYIWIANNCMALSYSDLNRWDSVLHYQFIVYHSALKDKNPQLISLAAIGLGMVYSKKGNDDSDFYFNRMAMAYAEKAGRRDVNASAKLDIAHLFYKRKQWDSSFFYTRQALQVLQNTNDVRGVSAAYSFLSKLYKTTGQYDSAYKYAESYMVLKDSLQNQHKITQAQNFSFNETLQQQELEQARKTARQQYQNKLKLYALIAIIIIILIIAFLLFKNNRNKQKANVALNKQKEEIQAALSNLKSTQKQLIQSEKMASLGELTAGIAHEIQNPLNFVNNFSEVNRELIAEMKGELAKGNAQLATDIANDIDENEEKIIHHGKRADAIVKGMLQHSRVSSGKKEPTNINALADEYLRLSYHGMRAKDKTFNVTMKTDFDESIGMINVVPQDIGRVLLNLFNNAFYACAERSRSSTGSDTGSSTDAERSRSAISTSLDDHYEPTVWVSTKRVADVIPPLGGTRGAGAAFVEIRVRDNGNGIPEKIKDKIFQPFFTTKPTGEGTGLGLSLSYDMVKAHGGEIKVNSKEGETSPDDPVGRGTEFVVILPE